jgi:hypothetical protein
LKANFIETNEQQWVLNQKMEEKREYRIEVSNNLKILLLIYVSSLNYEVEVLKSSKKIATHQHK